MGFSKQEYWSGVPLPSPLLFIHCYQKLRITLLLLACAMIKFYFLLLLLGWPEVSFGFWMPFLVKPVCVHCRLAYCSDSVSHAEGDCARGKAELRRFHEDTHHFRAQLTEQKSSSGPICLWGHQEEELHLMSSLINTHWDRIPFLHHLIITVYLLCKTNVLSTSQHNHS